MSRLVALLLGVCLLRRGPQDLPYSPRLTRGLLLLLVGVHFFALRLFEGDPNQLARSLGSLALLLGLPWLLLGLRGRRSRYAQTLAAFLGTGLLFTLAFLPLRLALGDPAPDAAGAPPGLPGALLRIAAFAVVGWKIAINGHIWRHALDWPASYGLPFAFALFVLELLLLHSLFPAAPGG